MIFSSDEDVKWKMHWTEEGPGKNFESPSHLQHFGNNQETNSS